MQVRSRMGYSFVSPMSGTRSYGSKSESSRMADDRGKRPLRFGSRMQGAISIPRNSGYAPIAIPMWRGPARGFRSRAAFKLSDRRQASFSEKRCACLTSAPHPADGSGGGQRVGEAGRVVAIDMWRWLRCRRSSSRSSIFSMRAPEKLKKCSGAGRCLCSPTWRQCSRHGQPSHQNHGAGGR
jgi:hypothetical protein